MSTRTFWAPLAALFILQALIPGGAARSFTLWHDRRPCVSIQFDDGCLTHYTVARPILMRYGLIGSFGIPTGWIDVKPDAMTTPMLREMLALGYQFQDHTESHNAALWNDSRFESQWQAEIAFSQAFFARVDSSLYPMRAWNKPGGSTPGFAPQVEEVLKLNGYARAAGLWQSNWDREWDFHYGTMDDPFNRGRAGIDGWGLNAAATGWTWQTEVSSIISKTADAVAQGLLPIIGFHIVDENAAAGLDSLCEWLVAQNIEAVGLDDLFELGDVPASSYYGMDLAAPLDLDRDGNGRADGWWHVDISGNATSGAYTTIYGIPSGKLVVSVTMEEPLQPQSTDEFEVIYKRTTVDPVTYGYVPFAETRTHTFTRHEILTFTDTLLIPNRTDRLKISFDGVGSNPYKIYSLSAVAMGWQSPTAAAPYAPKAALAVRISPNPSSGTAHIDFTVDRPAQSRVEIYSADGRLVERLADSRLSGNIDIVWRNRAVAEGVYFVKVTAGERVGVAKITLVR